MGWQAPCSRIELSTPHPLQSTPTCLRGLAGAIGILCCLPIERNATVSSVPLRPQPSRVAGWTPGTPRVPGRPRPVAWLPRPTVRCARSLGCGTLRAGAGSVTTGSVRPTQRILSLDANDRRARLEPAASGPVGRRAGVGVAKERYLVDPASSHMLVSKIKPCMCKYELIQTVKLRMAH